MPTTPTTRRPTVTATRTQTFSFTSTRSVYRVCVIGGVLFGLLFMMFSDLLGLS